MHKNYYGKPLRFVAVITASIMVGNGDAKKVGLEGLWNPPEESHLQELG